MSILSKVALAAAGPMGWIASAISTVFDFCVKHWKLVLIVLTCAWALSYAFVLGDRYGTEKNEASWQKKETARLALEALVDSEHKRTVGELDANIDAIEAKAKKAEADRAKAYDEIDKRVKDYVAKHSGSTCGIDDDGVRLLVDTIRARVPRANQSH